MTRTLVTAALAVGLLVLAVGVALASGAVSFSEPVRPVVATAPAPSVEVTPTVDLDAARSQLMSDESQMCNCGR